MPIVTRHSLLTVVVLVFASLLIIGIFIWSGIYNIGADDTHSRPVYSILQMVRERSITARANRLHPPPNLNDAALVRQGAGNYAAMCAGCHLAPGMAETELSKGLYPAPPNLSKQMVDAASAFWIIKHGIKASGMPAWGKSMSDEYIWNMVAFLQVLPKLDAGQYQALVASSGGHDHGGGETEPQAGGAPIDQHDEAGDEHDAGDDHGADGMSMGPAMDMGGEAADDHGTAEPAGTISHQHADGTVESHPAPPTEAGAVRAPPDDPATPSPDATPEADDGHDDQH